jgi:D-aminopeptidase
MTVLGVPVGQHLTAHKLRGKDQGSVIAIVATDAPLLPHQLKRLARRVPMGLARTGTVGNNGSGDIFLAFSTANEQAYENGEAHVRSSLFLRNNALDPLFNAVVEAVEEAVIDSIMCNETMTGRDGNMSVALPVDQLLELMKKYKRI